MIKNIFKISIRNLLKHGVFSSINIIGLAIGLAAFLLINAYVRFERSYDRFHEDSDQLYRLTTDQIIDGEMGVRDAMSFAPSGRALVEELPEVISYTTTYKFDDIIFRKGDNLTVESKVIAADSNYFDHFTYKILQGDPTTILDEPYSIVLTESKAREYFGDEDALGKTLELLSDFQREFIVTGIIQDIPPNTHYTFNMIMSLPSIRENIERDAWSGFNYYTYLKMQKDIDWENLKPKLGPLTKKYLNENTKLVFNIQPVEEIHLFSDFTFEPEIHGNARTVDFLEIISILIIFIAWINYINLSTARSIERAKEVGLRKVVGAYRRQIFLQFMFESLMINVVGALIALILAELLLPSFNMLIGKQIALHLWNSPYYLMVLLGFSLVGAWVAGFYPSMVLSGFKPVTVLKGKFRSSSKGLVLRKGLVILQFTASIALISATFVVQDQVKYMLNKDLGFDVQSMIAFGEPSVPDDQRESLNLRLSSFKDELEKQSPIISVGSVSNLPGGGSSDISSSSGLLKIAGISEPKEGTTYLQWIDDQFIPTIGLNIVAGRNFDRERQMDTSAVIVNEAFLRKFDITDPESIILENIQFGRDPDNDLIPIIGVVNDFHRTTLKRAVEPSLYFYYSHPGNTVVKIDPDQFNEGLDLIAASWQGLFSDYPYEYVFIDERFEQLYREERQFGSVFTVFSVLALIVASLGLFGLSSYTAVQRTKEMGIRKVLGASITGITILFYREFLWLTLIALIIGVPAVYYGMESWLNNYSFRIEFPWIWLVVSLAVVLVSSFVTVSLQIMKVARLNPTDTLRYE